MTLDRPLTPHAADDGQDARPAWAYLVECADGTLYAGWCYEVAARVAAHNAGRGAKYTRSRRPVTLRWCEAHPTRSAAQQREAALKQLTRAQKLALVRETEFFQETLL